MEIISYVLVALIGAIIGVLIYRNNVKDFSPKFDEFDEKIKPLVDKVNELADKVEEKVK
jgi:uncharacterized protein YoxC